MNCNAGKSRSSSSKQRSKASALLWMSAHPRFFRPLPILQTDRVPRRFEFHRVEYPVRVFGFGIEPLVGGERMVGVTLKIKRCAGLQFRADLGTPGSVHDRIDVHVTGDVRQ